jgi:hypothetical protein
VESELDTRVITKVLLTKANNPEKFAFFKAFPFTVSDAELLIKDDQIFCSGTVKRIKSATHEFDTTLDPIIARNIKIKSFILIRKLGILASVLRTNPKVGCLPETPHDKKPIGIRNQTFSLFG